MHIITCSSFFQLLTWLAPYTLPTTTTYIIKYCQSSVSCLHSTDVYDFNGLFQLQSINQS